LFLRVLNICSLLKMFSNVIRANWGKKILLIEFISKRNRRHSKQSKNNLFHISSICTLSKDYFANSCVSRMSSRFSPENVLCAFILQYSYTDYWLLSDINYRFLQKYFFKIRIQNMTSWDFAFFLILGSLLFMQLFHFWQFASDQTDFKHAYKKMKNIPNHTNHPQPPTFCIFWKYIKHKL